MDRRKFLQVTAGTSGLIVLGSYPWTSLPKLAAATPKLGTMPDMDGYVARVDEGLKLISRWTPTDAYPGFEGDRAQVNELGPKSLRTLFITGMLTDLPPEGQAHPAMQERIWSMMTEMDEATSGMESYLEALGQRELANLQHALRFSRTLGMDIFEGLDEHAAVCGVSNERRLQTRVLFTDAAWRLRNQPPDLVIQESLRKAHRVEATDFRREAREDVVAARVGEQIFWAEQQGQFDGNAPADSTEYESLRKKRLSKGAKKMGIGLLVGGIAAGAAAAGAVPLVFVATVGAVILVIGLITILVGLATSPSARTPIKRKK